MSDSSDPMGCSLPGFSIHGIFQARILEWGAIAFSGKRVKLGIKKKKIVSHFESETMLSENRFYLFVTDNRNPVNYLI